MLTIKDIRQKILKYCMISQNIYTFNGSFPFSKMHFSLHQRIAGILRQVFANFVRGYTIAPPIINFGHLIFAKFNKFLHSSLGVGSFKILLSLLSTFKTHKFC